MYSQNVLLFYNSLLKDFPTSEEVWNLVARRAIDETNSQVKKGTAVITGLCFSSQIFATTKNGKLCLLISCHCTSSKVLLMFPWKLILVSGWPCFFNLNAFADNQWSELEMEMNKLYHQAVKQVPTGKHYTGLKIMASQRTMSSQDDYLSRQNFGLAVILTGQVQCMQLSNNSGKYKQKTQQENTTKKNTTRKHNRKKHN